MTTNQSSIAPTPYNTWTSPISSSMLTDASISLDELKCADKATYWIEKRPNEGGRCVIVKHDNDSTRDMLPSPYSARNRVHEYGGGAYCCSGQSIYFVNDADQNIYCVSASTPPLRITNTDNCSYADLSYDSVNHKITCVCEAKTSPEKEAVNTIISLDIESGAISTLCQGMDFYSNPRLSQCGSMLAYLCWNHPDMPWDCTHLFVTDYCEGITTNNLHTVCKQPGVSCFQPEWSSDNKLYYICDQSGWWNLYCYDFHISHQITDEEFEFGLPQWVFSQSTYAFIDEDNIICSYIDKGISRLATIETKSRRLTTIDCDYSVINSVQSMSGDYWFIGASSNTFPSIIKYDTTTTDDFLVKSSCSTDVSDNYFSKGQYISFNSRHDDIVHAIYYPPCHPEFTVDENRLPPLIVLAHGGPTGMASTSLDLRKQFWTSRGYAILDVNYSGSTGYGRQYRQRLLSQWGVRDVEDCCDAALHLVRQSFVDAEKLIIKGSSAGGYTVLCALTFQNVFSAGASYYGIGNLKSLLSDTHKFESRYLDKLIGSYDLKPELYDERSPIEHTDQLNCPVIILQGTEDKVVPREQALSMYESLLNKGIAVTLLEFEGEQHGFRKAETIRTAIDSELSFYAAVLNIKCQNCIDIKIDNFIAPSL